MGNVVELYDWQKDILAADGDLIIKCGRQVGKSLIVSIKVAEYAAAHPNTTIMCIAFVERQANLLFEKITNHLYEHYKDLIEMDWKKPTRTQINLTNGSRIYCLPTGLNGWGIKGYTINVLVADEAALIPEAVWNSIIPALSATKGKQWILSTPLGKQGYFYECWKDSDFKKFHVSAEICPHHSKEFLKKEEGRMSDQVYAQEYLAEFVDELRQLFPNTLIEQAMTLSKDSPSLLNKQSPSRDLYLGVDLGAGVGRDETVLLSVIKDGDRITQFDMDVTTETMLTQTIKKIINLDSRNHYKMMYIDDGGLGVGVFQHLLHEDQTKRRVEAINNARRSINRDETRSKNLMKQDLYINLLRLLETKSIELFTDPDIMLSLSSVQYEYKDGKMLIFGNYTHIAE